jgi:hypothetical protein
LAVAVAVVLVNIKVVVVEAVALSAELFQLLKTRTLSQLVLVVPLKL